MRRGRFGRVEVIVGLEDAGPFEFIGFGLVGRLAGCGVAGSGRFFAEGVGVDSVGFSFRCLVLIRTTAIMTATTIIAIPK